MEVKHNYSGKKKFITFKMGKSRDKIDKHSITYLQNTTFVNQLQFN